eukprot:TRINITY_DN72047_c0_g1_i1.p1 TRINITY_DN72047_c0_g1~~TRINITY_DN72047_c0_g1_i1.p1  ORF type:complete len:291 (-),score=50.38 TRINITY_DN72047_c0_g1_i1:166-1038(-)
MDARYTQQVLDEMMQQTTPTSVIVGYVVTALLGVVGGFCGCYAGWFISDGFAPILGSMIGFVLFALIGLVVSGVLTYHLEQLEVRWPFPDASRLWEVGVKSFDMYVTVHRIQNVKTSGMIGAQHDFYVEVKVGRLVNEGRYFSVVLSPPNRTCVQTSGIYEECFRFTVNPTDDTIKIVLLEQDMIKDDEWGSVHIDIDEEVIKKGFPQKRAYKLTRHVHDEAGPDADDMAGTVVVSFAPGADFSKAKMMGMQETHKLAVNEMRVTQKKLADKARQNYGAYGTWSTTAEAV